VTDLRPPDPAAVVLVVDEDAESRQGLLNVLATSGIRALGAGSADAALRMQARHHPAVAVCDIDLSDGDGAGLARDLRACDAEMPVLLLAHYASVEAANAAVGRLDAYLIKPVAPRTLLQSVHNALARRGLVAENRSLADRLRRLSAYQALYDPLTGLPNRALLDDRLRQALATGRRSGTSLAVLFVDLDGFKLVNDLFGHHIGDLLLREMADRLAATRRQSDTVARFGGDEFVVICPDINTSAAACRIAEQLLAELAVPAVIEGVEHRLTASVGIALTGSGERSPGPETLLRNADTAMYRAKEEGRSGWELFDDGMRDRVVERFAVEHGLRAAMEAGDLTLAYQPVVDLGSGEVVGAEALLRWHRTGHGTVLPGSFLTVAEESGLIVSIGRWALDKALSDLAGWRDDGRVRERFRLWINVSPHQLANPRFAELVAGLVDSHDIPANLVGFEIVEEVLRDVGATRAVLHSLRDLGVALNVDDFGAGHSNLSWLQELPVTGIKIDRRFVATLDGPGDRGATAIIRGLASLGRALGLTVMSEGVETQGQAEALVSLGCELAQGYFFGYPGTSTQLWSASAAWPVQPDDGDLVSAEPGDGRRLRDVVGER